MWSARSDSALMVTVNDFQRNAHNCDQKQALVATLGSNSCILANTYRCEIATVAIWASSYATLRLCLSSCSYSIPNWFIAATAETLSAKEYLDVILEGLPQDYESTISFLSWRFGLISIIEVETHTSWTWSHNERFRKKSTPSIIVASSVASKCPNSVPLTNLSLDNSSQASDDVTDLNYSQGSGNHDRGGRNGRGGGRSTLDVKCAIRMAMMHQTCYATIGSRKTIFQVPTQPLMLYFGLNNPPCLYWNPQHPMLHFSPGWTWGLLLSVHSMYDGLYT